MRFAAMTRQHLSHFRFSVQDRAVCAFQVHDFATLSFTSDFINRTLSHFSTQSFHQTPSKCRTQREMLIRRRRASWACEYSPRPNSSGTPRVSELKILLADLQRRARADNGSSGPASWLISSVCSAISMPCSASLTPNPVGGVAAAVSVSLLGILIRTALTDIPIQKTAAAPIERVKLLIQNQVRFYAPLPLYVVVSFMWTAQSGFSSRPARHIYDP